MFELLDRSALGESTDAALIDALEHRTRAEAIESAGRLATIAEIVARHCDDEDDITAFRVIDGWESATAAISAACNLTRRAASTQMRIAQALRERLPKVAAVFARGDISTAVVSTITWRTQLINDEDALRLVDTALAGAATTYGALTATKTEQAIDVWVEKFDPAAVRRTRTAARERDIHFGDPTIPTAPSLSGDGCWPPTPPCSETYSTPWPAESATTTRAPPGNAAPTHWAPSAPEPTTSPVNATTSTAKPPASTPAPAL